MHAICVDSIGVTHTDMATCIGLLVPNVTRGVHRQTEGDMSDEPDGGELLNQKYNGTPCHDTSMSGL